jgi:hypothetical protein
VTITMTYREALRAGLRDALANDDRVFLMGEDIGAYGGCFAVTMGLWEEFGPERVRDTPLSESAFVGAGIGAALGGLRPVVEIMTVNFALLALDQIMNNAATLLHMSRSSSARPPEPDVSWRPSTATASRPGSRTFRDCASWLPRRSPTPARCSPRRWPTRTRC